MIGQNHDVYLMPILRPLDGVLHHPRVLHLLLFRCEFVASLGIIW